MACVWMIDERLEYYFIVRPWRFGSLTAGREGLTGLWTRGAEVPPPGTPPLGRLRQTPSRSATNSSGAIAKLDHRL